MELKPVAAGTSIDETRQRAVGYTKLAESTLRVLSDFEKDRIRQEFFARYKNLEQVQRDPEFQIRIRDVDRETERRRADLATILKLIHEHDAALAQLGAREKEVLAREKEFADRDAALKAREEEYARRVADSDKTAAETLAAAEKQAAEALAEAQKTSAAMHAEGEAALKEKAEAAARATAEAEALKAKLAEELKRVNEVLAKAKQELAAKLSELITGAQANLDQAGHDVEDLLK